MAHAGLACTRWLLRLDNKAQCSRSLLAAYRIMVVYRRARSTPGAAVGGTQALRVPALIDPSGFLSNVSQQVQP
jgi:hypothetical protein